MVESGAMEFTSALEKQRALVEIFTNFSDPEAKYEKIIELGRSLTPLSEEYHTPENLVEGCQSRLYLRAFMQGDVIRYQASSDALISAGLAALLLAVYDHEPPEAILQCPPEFLQEIGIFSSLSPNRSNGLRSLFRRMQREAALLLTKA